MMSLNGIFALFGFPEGEDRDDEREKLEKDFRAYKETPHFKLGMFHKLIMNGTLFKKQILKFFSKSDPELDTNGIDDAGEYMMYTRAYYWVQDCKIRSKFWNTALKEYSNDEFLCSIKLSIHYFESIEEYEKCAHLKKIQDFVEKNLPK
jgi:hypothetical protein